MRATKKVVERRLEFIRNKLDLDYELQYSSAYSYPCKIISRGGSHDESERTSTSEAVEWCNGFLNAYYALYDKLKPRANYRGEATQ